MEIRKGMRAEGDPRERKRASGEELSASPSRVTAAEPRLRHWGHRAVTVTIGLSSPSVPLRGEFAREGGDVERESCARKGSFVQPSLPLSRVGGCATEAPSPSMESQVCIAIKRKSAMLRENQLERGRGVASAASLPSSPSSRLVTAAVSLFSCHSRSCAPSRFCHRWSRHLLGIVYRELLHRTPPLEPSFRCCPLALSHSIVAASVIIVAARFSRTSLVCSRRCRSLVAMCRLVAGFWFISAVLPLQLFFFLVLIRLMFFL